MFDHPDIQKYPIDQIPKDRDLYLMGEKWMEEYEAALKRGLAGEPWEYPGYISHAAVREASATGLEISWFPNIFDRFHEVRVFLPAADFIKCVGCRDYDEKPHIFVSTNWLEDLHRRTHSVFALVDAIGVKTAILAGTLTADKIQILSQKVDEIASRYPDIAFFSFADSLLLKMNWIFGDVEYPVDRQYDPERIIRVLPEIAAAYSEVLGLGVYTVITQGQNHLYPDELLRVSASANHVSLNSLGLPFAQLLALDAAARANIKLGEHGPEELYMDESFFRSLKLKFDFDKNAEPHFPYLSPMALSPFDYFVGSIERILQNLESK